jgi:hypothetical protein
MAFSDPLPLAGEPLKAIAHGSGCREFGHHFCRGSGRGRDSVASGK